MESNNSESKKPIKSFRDLEVYQNTYKTMLVVMKEIIPQLPESEKYDLKDQLSRACKAIPRLIAEDYAKRHQKAGFQKYLDDAMAECNEMIVSLEQARDLYDFDREKTNCLVDIYDKSGRQLYNLSKRWTEFKKNERK
ncbi:MAG: four helix bundle protein [Candidatus Brocadia sp.]|jgi:four helix bundle protein